MPPVDSSDRDNKETLLVKEEATNDAEVFGEVVVDVEGSLFGFVCAENRPLTWFLRFLCQNRGECNLD